MNSTHSICSKFYEEPIGIRLTLLSENGQIVSLRDFLLPMLVNGQVKVGK